MWRLLLVIFGILCQITPTPAPDHGNPTVPRDSKCIRAGSLTPLLSSSFGNIDATLNGLTNNDAYNSTSMILQPVNVLTVTSLAYIYNASNGGNDEPFSLDLSYAMPGYNQVAPKPSSLNLNYLFMRSDCSYDNSESANYGHVDVSFSSKKQCVGLAVKNITEKGVTTSPAELTNANNKMAIILGQQVTGPPETLKDNNYNTFWLEKDENGDYLACFREGITFSKHQKGKINWFATDGETDQWVLPAYGNSNADKMFMEMGRVEFNLTGNGEDKLCQVIPYKRFYLTVPVVFTTPELNTGSDGEVAAWVESTCLEDFKVCVQRTGKEYIGPIDNVTIHYGAVGNHSSCQNMVIPKHKICRHSVMLCATNCTEEASRSCKGVPGVPIDEPLCSNDRGTYPNDCEFHSYVCNNYKEADHNYINETSDGECPKTNEYKGYKLDYKYPDEKIDDIVQVCNLYEKDLSRFNSFSDVEYIVSPEWNNTDMSLFHGATAGWIESANSTHYTACCRTTYSADFHADKCRLNLIQYQMNLKYRTKGRLEAGKPVTIPKFTSGPGCANVTELDNLDLEKYQILLSIFSPSEDKGGLTSWMERTRDSLNNTYHRFCVAPMKYFTGIRISIEVHWIKVKKTGSTLTPYQQMDEGQPATGVSCWWVGNLTTTGFGNGTVYTSVIKDVTDDNGISFANDHSSNLMAHWIESKNETHCRVCVEDLARDDQHYSGTYLQALYLPNL